MVNDQSLEEMAKQAHTKATAEQKRQDRQREEQTNQAKQHRLDEFRVRLVNMLGDLYPKLPEMELFLHEPAATQYQPSADFDFAGWHCRITGHEEFWKAFKVAKRYGSYEKTMVEAQSRVFPQQLLTALGARLADFEKEQREAEETRKSLAALDEQQKLCRTATIASADEIHLALQEEMRQKRWQAEATLYHWPAAGKEVTLYKMRFCKGASLHDGEWAFDYETVWTPQCQLDPDGWIEISLCGQLVRRRFGYHCLPSWDAHTFSEMKELPGELVKRVDIDMPDVYLYRDVVSLDEKLRLKRIPNYHGFDYERINTHVGIQPVWWICDLLDAA